MGRRTVCLKFLNVGSNVKDYKGILNYAHQFQSGLMWSFSHTHL